MAPLGSIPLVEQFTELVAWPGTQSSLRREYEGPTAQVPQHVEDDSSEATIPEPFVRGMETEETQEATTTPERSLEAASEPPAQGGGHTLTSACSRPFHSCLGLIRGSNCSSPGTKHFSSNYFSASSDR